MCPELSWGLQLLPFSLSVCYPLSSHTAMGGTAEQPGEPVPSLPSDPGHIPCPPQASVSSSPTGGCDFPAKDGATPHRRHRVSVEAAGGSGPASVWDSLQLLLPETPVSKLPSSSNPRRRQGLRPRGAWPPLPMVGVSQLAGQVPGRSQEELGFPTDG